MGKGLVTNCNFKLENLQGPAEKPYIGHHYSLSLPNSSPGSLPAVSEWPDHPAASRFPHAHWQLHECCHFIHQAAGWWVANIILPLVAFTAPVLPRSVWFPCSSLVPRPPLTLQLYTGAENPLFHFRVNAIWRYKSGRPGKKEFTFHLYSQLNTEAEDPLFHFRVLLWTETEGKMGEAREWG